MSANTKIEWADHTLNPWIGCTPISPGCINCYAAAWAKRYGRDFSERTRTKTWAAPLKWNAQHEAFHALHGRRQRVFCASLADVFDNEVDPQWRDDLWQLIWDTPNLDWLLLTKRIGNVGSMLPVEWGNGMIDYWPNVWIGATIVNQEEADRDIPKLLAVPAAKRFLSMEPLLGPVDIAKYLDPWTCSNCGHWGSEADSGPCKCADCDVESIYDESIGSDRCPQCGKDNGTSDDVGPACPSCEQAGGWDHDYGFKFDSEKKLLDWVIVGGESGPGARPMHPDWAWSLRNQCQAAGVPFLFKQWGEWLPSLQASIALRGAGADQAYIKLGGATHTIGRDDHDPYDASDALMLQVGKKAAGRRLDGITHDGFPS
ncbi:MAG: phage Gp37/Gp68 family protein [Aquabacterium sp.]|nr:phage Gp37/Gp68 family protein [Aquabacterium sp.]